MIQHMALMCSNFEGKWIYERGGSWEEEWGNSGQGHREHKSMINKPLVRCIDGGLTVMSKILSQNLPFLIWAHGWKPKHFIWCLKAQDVATVSLLLYRVQILNWIVLTFYTAFYALPFLLSDLFCLNIYYGTKQSDPN